MTISSTSNRVSYTGNGTTTSFSFPYSVIAAADLKVYQEGTLKTITTHYTLSGSAPYTSGTNVQFVTAPANGDEIVIYRDPAITQTVDLVENDPLPVETSVERPLDKLTMIAQRLSERMDRAFRLGDSDVSGASVVIPTPAADTFLAWDEEGESLINVDVGDLLTIGASANFLTQTFSGDGTDTTFTLSATPGNVENLDVFVSGVRQTPTTDYTVSGTTLTFTTAPASGTNNILVKWGTLLAVGTLAAENVTYNPGQTSDVDHNVRDKLRTLMVAAEDFGALGDGSADDTDELNSALARGLRVWLKPGATYKVTSSLIFADGSGLVSDGTATIYAPAADFSNTTLADKYDNDACVVNMSGQKISPYTARQDVVLDGVIIESEVSDGRLVDAVVAQNVDGLKITNCEIFGFPVGCGIRASSIIGRSAIRNNHIHDFTTNTDFSAQSPDFPQITGIEIDNDLVNSVESEQIDISGNTIEDLTFGATAITAHGYQTDGINIAKPDSARHTMRGNIIRNVGEGIDCFGRACSIVGNTILDCYIFGIKLMHGAQYNVVTGNTVRGAGLTGIVFGVAAASTQDNKGNVVSGNTVDDIDPDGNWSANATSCIGTTGSGHTAKVKDNLISSNVLNPGTNGKYIYGRQSDGTNNCYIDNHAVAAGASGWSVNTNSETGIVTEARKTIVRAYRSSTQAIGTGAAVKLQFDAETQDARGEYDNATNYRWTCQIAGSYRAHAAVRLPTLADGISGIMNIYKNGSPVSIKQDKKGGANDVSFDITDVIDCVPGDYLEFFFRHEAGGDRNITGQTEYSYMSITPA